MFIPVPVAYPGLAFLRLGGKSVRRGGASNDSRGGCAPQNKDGSNVTLVKNTKTTKRTQFKKCKSPCEN